MGDLGLQLKNQSTKVCCVFSHNHWHNCFKKHSFHLFILFITYHIIFLIYHFTFSLFVCFLWKLKVLHLPFCWFNLITFYILDCLKRFLYNIYIYINHRNSQCISKYIPFHMHKKRHTKTAFSPKPLL